MRVGGTYKTHETAYKAAKKVRGPGLQVDIKQVRKGYAVYKNDRY